jgi:hypothetical protein
MDPSSLVLQPEEDQIHARASIHFAQVIEITPSCEGILQR